MNPHACRAAARPETEDVLVTDQLDQPRLDAAVHAARSGDQAAFVELWRRYSPGVAGYLRLQGAEDPDSLTSEVFLGVYRDLRSFKGDETGFRALLYTIAHRRLIDDRRRRLRRPAPDAAELPDLADHPAEAAGPEEEVIERLRAERVREICEGLSDDQRDTLLLRILGGLTVAEVACELGKTVGAVKALQRRGLAAVRRSLVVETEGVPL